MKTGRITGQVIRAAQARRGIGRLSVSDLYIEDLERHLFAFAPRSRRRTNERQSAYSIPTWLRPVFVLVAWGMWSESV